MATREYYIYGSGGHGKVVATLLQSRRLKVKGFLDDDSVRGGEKVLGLPVFGGMEVLESARKRSTSSVIVGIGNNSNRKKIYDRLKQKEISIASVYHPSCVLHPSVAVGQGTVLMPGVIINVDTQVGENAILNTGVRIDHDCIISDHVHLAPGVILAGGVTVGEGAFLGVGVKVIPGVSIGAWAVVGAGGVVIEDVPSGQTVAGVPARMLSK